MKKLTTIAFVLFIIISSSRSQSQNGLWVYPKIGINQIKGDIGYKDYGIYTGVQLKKDFKSGFILGADISFHRITNTDKNTINEIRGYEMKTSIGLVEATFGYNIFKLIEDLQIFNLVIGNSFGYYISTHDFEHPHPLENQLAPGGIREYYEKTNHSYLASLLVGFSINVKNLQLGFCPKIGISGNDYLDGFSTNISEKKDRLYSYTIHIGYLIK